MNGVLSSEEEPQDTTFLNVRIVASYTCTVAKWLSGDFSRLSHNALLPWYELTSCSSALFTYKFITKRLFLFKSHSVFSLCIRIKIETTLAGISWISFPISTILLWAWMSERHIINFSGVQNQSAWERGETDRRTQFYKKCYKMHWNDFRVINECHRSKIFYRMTQYIVP